jgi:hypothetical protein
MIFLNRGALDVKTELFLGFAKCCYELLHRTADPLTILQRHTFRGTVLLTVKISTIKSRKQGLRIYKRCLY